MSFLLAGCLPEDPVKSDDLSVDSPFESDSSSTEKLIESDDLESDIPLKSGGGGLYFGTTNVNRSITGLILDDGEYYILYSDADNPNLIVGLVQGDSSSSNGTLSSNNAIDFNMEGFGIQPANVSASYQVMQSINGSISYDDGVINTFSGQYDTAYEITPSLSYVAGTYTGDVAFSQGFEVASLTISKTGILSGFGSSGCEFYGLVTARSSGNVYDITINFGDSPCYFENEEMSGIGYYDSTSNKIWSAATNNNRTEGILFIGTSH